METKICNKCGEEFPATTEYFYKDPKLGLQNACKTCKSERSKKYYLENREKFIKRQSEYRQEHREQHLEYIKKYDQNHKEQKSERAKKYYKKNKEQITEYAKKYRQENKEKKTTYNKKYKNILYPCYVASVLHIPTKDLTPELLEQKRLTILIKRELWQKET